MYILYIYIHVLTTYLFIYFHVLRCSNWNWCLFFGGPFFCKKTLNSNFAGLHKQLRKTRYCMFHLQARKHFALEWSGGSLDLDGKKVDMDMPWDGPTKIIFCINKSNNELQWMICDHFHQTTLRSNEFDPRLDVWIVLLVVPMFEFAWKTQKLLQSRGSVFVWHDEIWLFQVSLDPWTHG